MSKIKTGKTTKKPKTAISPSKKKAAKVKTAKAPSKKKAAKVKTAKAPSKKKTAKALSAVSKSKQKGTVSKFKRPAKTVSVSKKKHLPKKKERTSLREKRVQEIKLDLIKQSESLLNEAEVALNELPGQTVFPDLGDQATAETDRNFMLRLRGREQRLLKKIEEAIDRIDNGTFGICEDCGEEIDIKRLKARPVTTMCIDCKTLQEEEEKLRAS